MPATISIPLKLHA